MKKIFLMLLICLLSFSMVLTGCDSSGSSGGNNNGGVTYTISFAANGGTGTMASVTVDKGASYTVSACTFTAPSMPDGATAAVITFKGWNTAADGSGTAYAASDSATITADTTLYAQWTKPLFSVSDAKKVYFSKGNLVATYNSGSYDWGFAEHQYDYVGNAAGNTTIDSQTNGAKVDLFGWSGDGAVAEWGISTLDDYPYYSGSFKDWGKNIGDGSTWCTLTTEEWQYLLSTRGTGDTYFKYGVTVCGKANCLVIAPDGNSTAIASSYDDAAWATAEANGFVCLPSAGYRYKSTLYGVGGDGYFWSGSPCDSLYAYNLYFNGSYVNPASLNYCYDGCSVRLVVVE